MDGLNSVVIHRHQPTQRMRETPAQRYWTARDNTSRTTLNSAHNPKVIGSNPIPATKRPGQTVHAPALGGGILVDENRCGPLAEPGFSLVLVSP